MKTNSYPEIDAILPENELDDQLNSAPLTPSTSTNKTTPRAPAESHGININFCKNPNCENFGVPIESTSARGPGASNRYTVVGFEKGVPGARCSCCGEHFPLKSNQGVFEEVWRIAGETFGEPSCPVATCVNHYVPLSIPKAYYAYGLTKAGSQRYRCRVCEKIFSIKPKGRSPIENHRKSSKNLQILEMLVNKVPQRRICEMADIRPSVLYEKIDFFYEQALALMSERELKLPELKIDRLYIGVDRQEYAINWTCRKDRKNVILTAVASADNLTGYVFGMHPNFDPDADAERIGQDVASTGDDQLPAPHRRYARFWLKADYDLSLQNSVKRRIASDLVGDIANTYASAQDRADIESTDAILKEEKLPSKGMLVHSEYTLYAHFLRLEKLFKGVEKVRFFLDQDSGMRAACLGAFADRIKERSVDAFFVRITKDQTVDVKRSLVKASRNVFSQLEKSNPGLSKSDIKLLMLKQGIAAARNIGLWKDRWVMHPLPTLSEAEKASCFLTDMGDYDDDHQAWLHNKASLHAVDSWFNRLRRRNTMLERPIGSAANRGRTWNGYSAYKPEQIAKMLTILRVCHNYIWLPEKTKENPTPLTPAMKLGLAKGPLTYKDLVYFSKD